MWRHRQFAMKLILLLTCLYGTFETNDSTVENQHGCGTRRIVRGSKFIVGGRQAKMGEFPWMVALRFRSLGTHLCGGSLIKADIVLTAAHCIIFFKPSHVRVDAGIIDVSTGGGPYHQARLAVQFIHHKGFNMMTRAHDIGLIKLDRPFNISRSPEMIGTICITRKRLDYMKPIEVAGWGMMREGGRTQDFLRSVVVPVKPNSECYGERTPFASLAMFCAGAPGRDACKGDSGGPAMQHEEGRTVQVGIVSYGETCGKEHGYYTRVSSYINWIEHSIGNLQSADV